MTRRPSVRIYYRGDCRPAELCRVQRGVEIASDSQPLRERVPVMNSDDSLPLWLAQKVHLVCTRFEAAWKSGAQPRIEDYLADLGDVEKSEVLRELILLDIFYRRKHGESCRAEDYQARFPELTGEWLASVLPETAPGVSAPGDATVDWQPAVAPGVVIAGRYTLVEMIRAGGMGEVWVAKQTEPVKRKVALKFIKAGMDSKSVLARFEAERQALALMDHPNIAKVLDGGITAAGNPFFVMELVNGMPLTKFCDDAKLTPRQRLELFVPICQAVQHAHQKGIVHRDLKPSNILVTLYDGKASPKVIDFGVAKALAGKLTDESLSTQLGAVIGTLEYMAPEQAGLSAIDIDTRADIYSLGVVLYELLTGLRPFDAKRLRKAAFDELIRIIREEEPSKPSTRLSSDESLPSLAALRHTEPKRLVALMRGDLDCIVMKALEKERSRRYETANAFARDVQRYLADEPVEAQPPSMRYQLGKFLRRNKGRVLATSVVLFMLLLGLIAGTAGIIWHQNEESKRALRQALAEQAIGDAVEQAEKSRADLDQILRRPGGVFGLLNEPGRWQAHIQLAQAGVDRAKALLANADAPIKPDLNTRLQHLETLLGQDESDLQLALRLEKIRMDRSAWIKGKFDSATAHREYPRAFAAAKLPVLEGDPEAIAKRIGSSAIKEQLVAALDDWAWVDIVAGKEDLLMRLLEVARLANPDHRFGDRLRQPKVWKDRYSLTSLAKETPPAKLSPQLLAVVGLLLTWNKLEDENWLRQAQAHYPTDFWLNFDLGNAIEETKPVEAEGFYRAALAVRPGSTAAYNNLGNALLGQIRRAEAIAAYQKAIDLDPNFAKAYIGLGNALLGQMHRAEAIAVYQKAIDLEPKDAQAYVGLGIALFNQKRLAEAIAAYQKATDLDPKYPNAHGALGQALLGQGSFAEAVAATQRALNLLPAGDPLRAMVQRQQKQCQRLLALEKRLPLVLENKQSVGPDEFLALAQMCREYKNRHASAVRLYQEAFQAQQRLADDLGKQHRYHAACSAALAGCGQGEEAAKLKEEEKTKLRRQARDLLLADLDSYVKQLKTEKAEVVVRVIGRLAHWQQDDDFAGVRAVKELAKLPGEEKQAWQKLWTDVQRLHKDAQSRFNETRLEETLSGKENSKVHEIKMTAGETYVIDMESKAFDTFLKLEDAQGKLLAENDDISPTNRNSRIVFTAPTDGRYRVIATSFQRRGRGQYEIIIRVFAGKEKQPDQ
jgi:serine/threonine protein kinase/cytochrome c-type biogenesis protein CcmH/NrfG